MSKKKIIIGIALLVASILYTFLVAFISAPSVTEITYHMDAAFFAFIFGLISLTISKFAFQLVSSRYFPHSKSKYLLGFGISSLITFFFQSLFMWFFYGIVNGKWIMDFRMLKEFIMILNFQITLSLIYLGYQYSNKKQQETNINLLRDNNILRKEIYSNIVRITSIINKKTYVLHVDEIAYFQMDGGIIFAFRNKDGKKFPLNYTTLSNLEDDLSQDYFFRINRSEILSMNSIHSFEPYFKDRLAIKLNDPSIVLYTSNSKSSDFRKWLTSAPKTN